MGRGVAAGAVQQDPCGMAGVRGHLVHDRGESRARSLDGGIGNAGEKHRQTRERFDERTGVPGWHGGELLAERLPMGAGGDR